MPRIDLHQKVRDLLTHTSPLPAAVSYPFVFYEQSGTEVMNTLAYVERTIAQQPRYQAVVDRHIGRVYRTAVVELVEVFERFLKQSAAVCIDAVAPFVVDDRFNEFSVKGTVLAAHFDAKGLGEALCESDTWLNCEVINKRFRKTLELPTPGGAGFDLLSRDNAANRDRYETLSLLWQVRHTIVHNVGVVTRSDATKLRILSRRAVTPEVVLTPTRDDLRYVKKFLDEVAAWVNQRVGTRLADVLSAFLTQSPGLFDPGQMANEVSTQFQLPLTVGGVAGVVTSPP
jgi:hypothetical protein